MQGAVRLHPAQAHAAVVDDGGLHRSAEVELQLRAEVAPHDLFELRVRERAQLVERVEEGDAHAEPLHCLPELERDDPGPDDGQAARQVG